MMTFKEHMNTISLWLDDVRPMPEGFNIHAKTAEEAIKYLKTGNVVRISFDHDLGMKIPNDSGNIVIAKEEQNEKTGYDVAKWIEEAAYHNRIGPIKWNVHSANPVGAKKIRDAMRMADQYWSHHGKKR